jgi:hypothetical protein
MSTTAQIKANQQNAQFSQGPVSAEGLERSSKNAIKHGLTGQTLVLAPEEAESYSAHVSEYMAHYEPSGHYQRQLIQQLADSDWGVHQIFLLQSATISYMHSLSRKLAADPDNAELQAADARAVRKLATLNSYENRKRRASKMLREQIDELALQESVSKPPSKPMETKPEPEIGFVSPDPATPPAGADLQTWLRHQTAGMTVEEALKFAKSRR